MRNCFGAMLNILRLTGQRLALPSPKAMLNSESTWIPGVGDKEKPCFQCFRRLYFGSFRAAGDRADVGPE